MEEREQLTFLNSQMSHCISAIKRIEVVLIGDEYNKNGLVQMQEQMSGEIKEIKEYQLQQRGGISFGKWILGTSLGMFMITQFSEIQTFIKNIFK